LPFLEDLYAALQQHVQLAVLEGHDAVVVERLSTPRAVGLTSEVGGRLPLHSSGVGKVLLAHGGNELLEDVLSDGPARYTPHTLTDPGQLRRQLAECRQTGTATVREEMTTGADSVAARIMNAEGQVVAALSVVVRAGSVELHKTMPPLVASGLGISRRLGWTPQTGIPPHRARGERGCPSAGGAE
jgi:DNA-binding IclR family transcriptional regulator